MIMGPSDVVPSHIKDLKMEQKTEIAQSVGFLLDLFSRDSDLRNSCVSPSVCLFVRYQVV